MHLKTSTILKLAIPYLWDGKYASDLELKEEYICFALTRGIRKGNWNNKASDYIENKTCQLRGEIERRLHPSNNIAGWLAEVHKIPNWRLTPTQVQAHRLAWMKLLIAEYKRKKD